MGVGTFVLIVNVVLLGGYTARLPFAAAPRGGYLDRLRGPVPRRRMTVLAASIAVTCGGPGRVSSGLRSPTCTYASAMGIWNV